MHSCDDCAEQQQALSRVLHISRTVCEMLGAIYALHGMCSLSPAWWTAWAASISIFPQDSMQAGQAVRIMRSTIIRSNSQFFEHMCADSVLRATHFMLLPCVSCQARPSCRQRMTYRNSQQQLLPMATSLSVEFCSPSGFSSCNTFLTLQKAMRIKTCVLKMNMCTLKVKHSRCARADKRPEAAFRPDLTSVPAMRSLVHGG